MFAYNCKAERSISFLNYSHFFTLHLCSNLHILLPIYWSILPRTVPTVGCGEFQTPRQKSCQQITKFLLAWFCKVLYPRNPRIRIRCSNVVDSIIICYIYILALKIHTVCSLIHRYS